MTTRARVVLADCREAHAELVTGIQGSMWRRRWATVVALLRASMHALANVDRDSSPSIRAAIDAAWNDLLATKPTPTIFWEFIQQERNLILKQYASGAGQSLTVHLGPTPNETTYHMNDGPYLGRDPREVAQEAIEWVEQYLDTIDAQAGV